MSLFLEFGFHYHRPCDLLMDSSLLRMAPGCKIVTGYFHHFVTALRSLVSLWKETSETETRPRTYSPFSAPNQPLTQFPYKGRMLCSRRCGIKMLSFLGSDSVWMKSKIWKATCFSKIDSCWKKSSCEQCQAKQKHNFGTVVKTLQRNLCLRWRFT